MPILYTLVGLPASGKSTFCKSHPECVYISSDAIRAELYGNEATQGNANDVFAIVHERIDHYLTHGYNVIFDATNLTKHIRKRALSHKAYHIAIYFDIPIEVCKVRNLNRSRVVPSYVYDTMIVRMSKPTKSEGFDEVLIVHE